jgi:STE24 endopeptidase
MYENDSRKQKAREYERVKLLTGITESVFTFLLILLLVTTGFTKKLELFASTYFSNNYMQLLLFGVIIGLITMVISFPFDYFFGFKLEHKYELSNLTFAGWIREKAKGFLVGLMLGLPLVLLFYWIVSNYVYWWIMFGFIVTFYSILLAKIAPIFISLIFYV